MTDDVPGSKKWPQFSLRVMGSMIAIVAIVACGGSVIYRQQQLRSDLIAKEAALEEELAQLSYRAILIGEIHSTMRSELARLQTSEDVIREIDADRGNIGYGTYQFYASNLISFFIQNKEEKTPEIVAALIEHFHQADTHSQYVILDCLRELPNLTRDEGASVAPEVQEFLVSLQDVPDMQLQRKVAQTLKSYEEALGEDPS